LSNFDKMELGSSGLRRFAGRIDEEFLRELRGKKGIEIFKEMSDNDPIVGAFLFAIDMLIREVDWRVEPASDEQIDEEVAEFIESNLNDMSHTWQDLISEILSFLIFGFSYHEIVYKRRDGKASKFDDGMIGWRKMPIRAQETLFKWEFDKNGGIKGFWQQAPPRYQLVFIPIEKSLLFRTRVKKNNPEGRSVLRNAYRPWYFKKNIEEIEGIGIERDLAGLPVAYVPPNLLNPDASSQERSILNEIKDIIVNIRRDEQEGIVFPQAFDDKGNKLYDLELLSTGGRRQFDTTAIIQRYDQRISMTVLADFVLLGHEGVGSLALSEDKTDLFTLALRTWVTDIAEVFNRHAIPRLIELNGFQIEETPKLVPEKIARVDLTDISDFLQNLSMAGAPIFPDPELEEHLFSLANIPSSNRRNT